MLTWWSWRLLLSFCGGGGGGGVVCKVIFMFSPGLCCAVVGVVTIKICDEDQYFQFFAGPLKIVMFQEPWLISYKQILDQTCFLEDEKNQTCFVFSPWFYNKTNCQLLLAWHDISACIVDQGAVVQDIARHGQWSAMVFFFFWYIWLLGQQILIYRV